MDVGFGGRGQPELAVPGASLLRPGAPGVAVTGVTNPPEPRAASALRARRPPGEQGARLTLRPLCVGVGAARLLPQHK